MSEFIVTKTLVDKVVEATEYSRDLVGEVLTALKSLEPNLMYVFPAPPMPVQPAPLSPALISFGTVQSAFSEGRRSEIEGQDGDEAFRAFAEPLNIPVPPWSNAPYMPITDVGEAIREAEKIVRRANDRLRRLEKNSALKEHERAALSAAITCMNQEGLQS